MNDIEEAPPLGFEGSDETKPDERRKHKRLQVLWLNERNSKDLDRVWVISHDGEHPQKVVYGVVADVSRSGVKIIINQKDVIEDEQFHLVIHPPEELGIPTIELEGSKRWDDAAQKNVYCAIGLMAESENGTAQLLQLTESLEKNPENEKLVKCEIIFDD